MWHRTLNDRTKKDNSCRLDGRWKKTQNMKSRDLLIQSSPILRQRNISSRIGRLKIIKQVSSCSSDCYYSCSEIELEISLFKVKSQKTTSARMKNRQTRQSGDYNEIIKSRKSVDRAETKFYGDRKKTIFAQRRQSPLSVFGPNFDKLFKQITVGDQNINWGG